ncbi:hypothetical protein ACFY0G_17555 [Streptomyces sp. NPDC001552]|uniref:hypothetical protein n=1 Tax=Streptomyces sp. NPDC001552 TaxID=3364587 RepID=UPI0036B52952
MYKVTITHPAIEDRAYACADGGDLRTLVYGVARAQGEPVTDDTDMIARVGRARYCADIDGTALLAIGQAAVRVEPARSTASTCEGHEDLYVGLGETAFCDGTCKPLPRFGRDALLDLADALDDADLDENFGCSGCGLQAGDMCAGCGRCNCDRHDTCQRPAPAMA